MSGFFYGGHQQQQLLQNPHPMAPSHNHHGRSRRAVRMSGSQTANRQYRQTKNAKEMIVTEAPSLTSFRARFEAGRSFDLDDDLEFCPNLLSFDEVCLSPSSIHFAAPSSIHDTDLLQRQSVTSGSSDRSSLSSGSPESSPLQQQIQPNQLTPALSISSATTSSYVSAPMFNNNNNNNLKIHQPSALRSRNAAIPIVNPNTGSRIASPPSSVSPGMMQQTSTGRRWQ